MRSLPRKRESRRRMTGMKEVKARDRSGSIQRRERGVGPAPFQETFLASAETGGKTGLESTEADLAGGFVK